MRIMIRCLMNAAPTCLFASATLALPAVAHAQPTCTSFEVASGLQRPHGLTRTALGNLAAAESGTAAPNTGRISIIDPAAGRRTLLDGLPSGINDVGEPSGPSGVFMRGRTLYVAIGIGDSILAGGGPGLARANPSPSSPLFSSILAIHFSAHVERTTDGFTLSASHQRKLARGFPVLLADGWRNWILIRRVADIPNYISEPRPQLPENVRGSNPFDLVGVGHRLFVTDGGRNLVWNVNIPSGAVTTLAEFPAIPNPVPGPPVIEAVPTGIAYAGGRLLVTLFRGFPFPPGTSSVQAIDPDTGAQEALITGLRTAIDVRPIRRWGPREYLVLVHSASAGARGPFTGPGQVLHFEDPEAAGVVVDSCLTRPTSMALDKKSGTLFVAELESGRVVAIYGVH